MNLVFHISEDSSEMKVDKYCVYLLKKLTKRHDLHD